MLEGLDRVPWAKLYHAYGPATDVPNLVRALASSSKETRENAIFELYGNILHQGTRYEATAHAVPFLIELLESPGVAGKDQIVHLLVACATGYAEEYLPAGLDTGAWQAQLASLLTSPPPVDRTREGTVSKPGATRSEALVRQRLALENWERARAREAPMYLQWYLDAYDAVRRGVPTFARLANDMDEELRLAATFALAWFREDAITSTDVVRQRLETERAPRLVANAALTLGVLAGYLGQDESAALRPLLAAKEALVRQAAAIALVTSLGRSAPAQAVQELLVGLATPAREELPWNEGDFLGYLSKTVGSLGPEALETVLAPMLEALRTSTGNPALQITGVLLQVLLPEGAQGLTADRLTPPQRALLTALAESPRAWQFEGQLEGEICANFSLMMTDWGLPGSIEEMRTFLQGRQ